MARSDAAFDRSSWTVRSLHRQGQGIPGYTGVYKVHQRGQTAALILLCNTREDRKVVLSRLSITSSRPDTTWQSSESRPKGSKENCNMLHPRRRHNRLQSGTESDVFHLRIISYAPDSPSTTTNASATSKALKWLEVHGDMHEAGTQIPRASQRIAPLLEDPEAPSTLTDPGAIKWTGEEDAE